MPRAGAKCRSRTSGGGVGPAAPAASLVLHWSHMPICGVVDELRGKADEAVQGREQHAGPGSQPLGCLRGAMHRRRHHGPQPCQHQLCPGTALEAPCLPCTASRRTHKVEWQAPLDVKQIFHPGERAHRRQRRLHWAAQQQPLLELCRVAAGSGTQKKRGGSIAGKRSLLADPKQVQGGAQVPSAGAHSQVCILVDTCIPLGPCFLRRAAGGQPSRQAGRQAGGQTASRRAASDSRAPDRRCTAGSRQQGSSQSWPG